MHHSVSKILKDMQFFFEIKKKSMQKSCNIVRPSIWLSHVSTHKPRKPHKIRRKYFLKIIIFFSEKKLVINNNNGKPRIGKVVLITGGEAVEFSGGGDDKKSDGCVTENGKLTSFLDETVASFGEGNLSATFVLNRLDFKFLSPHGFCLQQGFAP